MTDEQVAEIARRWSRDGGMGNERSDEDYTDAGCRILARHAFADVNALLDDRRRLSAEIAALRYEIDRRRPCTHCQHRASVHSVGYWGCSRCGCGAFGEPATAVD